MKTKYLLAGALTAGPVDPPLMPGAKLQRMSNTDHIRELLEQIRDAERRLAGLRAKLARLVEDVGKAQR